MGTVNPNHDNDFYAWANEQAELLRGGDAHVCGDWCIADTDLALMLQRLVAHGDELPAPLERYARRQWERPTVQAWLALPRQA